MNSKLVIACQMAGGGLTLAQTYLHFLNIKGSVKRFNYIEHHVEETKKKSFVAAKDSVRKVEMELIIKHDFNRKRLSSTYPLNISCGKNKNQ